MYITHLMKQIRLQLSSACVRVGRHSSLPPPNSFSLYVIIIICICNLLQPIVCILSVVSVHIFLIHLCATVHTNPHLSLLPHFLFTKILKMIYGFFLLSLICIFCRQYLFPVSLKQLILNDVINHLLL